MKTGLHKNIPFKDYLALPYISNSYLGKLAECPASVKIERVDTPSMILGRAAHTLILEGLNIFSQQYAKAPDIDKRTKEGRAALMVSLLENEGKILLSADDFQKIIEIREAVLAHPFAKKLLAENITEQTIIWEDRESGLTCKGRPDAIPAKNKFTLIDLKTTADASVEGFTRSIAKYGYARQAAFYIDGYGAASQNYIDSFVFIAVETAPPYMVGCYLLDDEFMGWGRNEYRRLLTLEKNCREAGEYPHYLNDGLTQIFKPRWL